jgi:hypothetical protein
VAHRAIIVVGVLAVAFMAIPLDVEPPPPAMDVFRAAEHAIASFPRPLPSLDNLNRTLGGDDLIPEYLDQDAFLGSLVRFGNSLPSSSVSIIWGTKDSGKSRGIGLLTRAWLGQGRLVIDVDLKGFVGTFSEFQAMLRDAFRAALLEAPGTIPFQHLVRVARVHHAHNPAAFDGFLGLLPEWCGSRVNVFFSWIPTLRRVADFKTEALDAFVTAALPETRPDVLFDTLEMLGRQNPALAPIFVFHEFGQLYKLRDTNTSALEPHELTESQKGEAWLDKFAAKLESKKATPTISSVILETSETSWRGLPSLHNSRATFMDVLVSDLDQELAAPALKRLAHWTDAQIAKVPVFFLFESIFLEIAS